MSICFIHLYNIYVTWKQCKTFKQFDEFGGNLYLSLSTAWFRESPFKNFSAHFDNTKNSDWRETFLNE